MSLPEAGGRTVLAWRRSGLSLVACGFTMIRGIGVVSEPHRPVAGAVVMGLGVAVWAMFVWIARRRSTVDLTSAPRPAGVADIAPVALATAAIGLVCIMIDLIE